MYIDQIRQIIQNAAAHEEKTGALANHLRQILKESKNPVPEESVKHAVLLVREYIEHVPVLLEQSTTFAAQVGELENIAPLLENAAGYFLNPADYIPDHLGLYGLIDDAYLTSRLLERLSAIYRQTTGFALISADLSGPNRVIRIFLGKTLAARLDQEIEQTVQQRIYQLAMQNLAAQQYNGSQSGRSWGGTFEDQSAQFFAENGVSYNVDTQYVDGDGVQLY